MRFRNITTLLFLIGAFVVTSPTDAHAALLYLDPQSSDAFRGDSLTVNLRVDTDEGECINTVDGVLHYDESIRAIDISKGNSILDIWVEDPVIDETNHTIKFAGGIPGGYCGRIPGDPSLTNILLTLVFRSPGLNIGGGGNNQSARIWVDENSQVLLHDGYGTNAQLRTQEAVINLLQTPGSTISDAWKNEVNQDKDIPSDFVITLTKDDTAFSGKYFIVFNSSDKQTGIDHYEVMEEPFSEFNTFKWGRADAPWIKTDSPYVLKDQTLNSTIRVKAIDKAGNERVVTLVPDTALRSMSRDMIITVSLGLGILVLIVALTVYALYKRKQRLLGESVDEES